MLFFEKFTLNNGLKVILHKDVTTPLAAVNIAYNVGSRDEDENKTGLAHLFEHLMFGGSKNIPSYDRPLQMAGGENNAFTNTDFTNYYLTLPAQNLETALWLESDRMKELEFSEKSFITQQRVVIEEFKQSYLNQPYGDVMLLLKPLAYKVHPYQWNTIGKNIQQIEDVCLEDIKHFFYTFYRPNNAVLSIAGNIDMEKTKDLILKWFGDIPKGNSVVKNFPKEPPQKEARFLEVKRQVPCNMFIKAYHTCKRTDEIFYATDIVSDILSNGMSSRLQQNLVNKKRIFSSISSYLTATFDEGLMIFSGTLSDHVTFAEADKHLEEELHLLKTEKVEERELEKIKNKIQTLLYYSDLSVQDKALNLAVFETMSKAEDINNEEKCYQKISVNDVLDVSKKLFRPENSSTIYYQAGK